MKDASDLGRRHADWIAREEQAHPRLWRWRDPHERLDKSEPGVAVSLTWLDETPQEEYRWRFSPARRVVDALDFHLREYCVRHTDKPYTFALAYRLSVEIRLYQTHYPSEYVALSQATLDEQLGDLAVYVAAVRGAPLTVCTYYNAPLIQMAARYPDGEEASRDA